MADNATILNIHGKNHTKQAFDSARRDMEKLEKAGTRANSNLDRAARQSRQGLAQFSYQVQDVAVQLQGGQSPFIIFAQQGSQIASIFGAGGAAFGAVVAIGAAIATALVPNLFDSATALEKLVEAGDEADKLFKNLDDGAKILSDEMLRLAQTSAAAAEILIREKKRTIVDGLSSTRDEAKVILEDLNLQIAFALSGGNNPMPLENFQKNWGVAVQDMERLQNATAAALSGSKSDIENFVDLINQIDESGQGTSRFSELASSISMAFVEITQGEQQVSELNAALADMTGIIAATAESNSDAAKSAKENRDSIEKMIESLQKQADTYGMGSTAIALYEARLAGATAEQQQQIAVLAGEVELRERAADALKAEEKAREDALKASQAARDVIKKEAMALADPIDQLNQQYLDRQEALRQALTTEGVMQTEHNALMVDLEKARIKAIADAEREAQDKQMQIMQARYQAAGQLAKALHGAMVEGSAAQKAMFVISQGIAAADAIISGNVGAMKALATNPTDPATVAYSNWVRAQGYVTAGIIAGQTIGSFEGGGFTGYGARAGGIDGRGGMPAIVHPNETIIDHTKGGGGVNVNITIQANDARGFDELLAKRRGMIASMVQASLNNVGRTI